MASDDMVASLGSPASPPTPKPLEIRGPAHSLHRRESISSDAASSSSSLPLVPGAFPRDEKVVSSRLSDKKSIDGLMYTSAADSTESQLPEPADNSEKEDRYEKSPSDSHKIIGHDSLARKESVEDLRSVAQYEAVMGDEAQIQATISSNETEAVAENDRNHNTFAKQLADRPKIVATVDFPIEYERPFSEEAAMLGGPIHNTWMDHLKPAVDVKEPDGGLQDAAKSVEQSEEVTELLDGGLVAKNPIKVPKPSTAPGNTIPLEEELEASLEISDKADEDEEVASDKMSLSASTTSAFPPSRYVPPRAETPHSTATASQGPPPPHAPLPPFPDLTPRSGLLEYLSRDRAPAPEPRWLAVQPAVPRFGSEMDFILNGHRQPVFNPERDQGPVSPPPPTMICAYFSPAVWMENNVPITTGDLWSFFCGGKLGDGLDAVESWPAWRDTLRGEWSSIAEIMEEEVPEKAVESVVDRVVERVKEAEEEGENGESAVERAIEAVV